MEKAREFQKNIYFCFIDYAKAFACLQFSSVTQLCLTLFDSMNRNTPGLPVHYQLSESTQTHVHRVCDAIQPSHHLSSHSPPALNFFQHQGLFKWVSSLQRWPNYWSFSFNNSPSNEHPGLIFRMDWLDLLAVQRTLKSLLQQHSSKASVLLCSAFFIVQLSHPYMTTCKTIALLRRTFVDKHVCSLINLVLNRRIAANLLKFPSYLVLFHASVFFSHLG